MQYDGSVWINTEMDSDGIVKGFERIKDGAGDVAVTVKRVGNVIDKAFSVAGDSSAVTTACRKLEELARSYADVGNQLEEEKKKLATLKEDYEYLSKVLDPLSDSGPKGFDLDLDTYLEYTEALKALPPEIEKQQAVVDRLEKQWQKSSEAIEAAVTKVTQTVNKELDKQAEAAERAAERKENAAEREVAANRRAASSTLDSDTGSVAAEFQRASTAAGNFRSRLGKLASAAFVFDIIRRGLQGIVSYFGKALMANNDFANAVGKLKASLQVAFQPIYEAVLPALVKFVEWLSYAVQAVGRLFAALAGRDYNEMRKNAASLNNTLNGTSDTMQDTAGSTNDTSDAIDNVGDSIEDTGEKAKEAEKSLAGFDEINRLLKEDADDLSGTLDDLNKEDNFDYADDNYGSGGTTIPAPSFEEFAFPEEWAAAIEELGMRIHDIFFEWEDLNPEVIAEKLIAALAMIAGGFLGFSLIGGAKGAIIGIAVGAALSIAIASLIFDGDGELSGEEIAKLLVFAITTIIGGVVGVAAGGPLGALIGLTIGAGLGISLMSVIFENDGKLSSGELIKTLVSCIAAIGGAVIGAIIGGPGGAVIGFTVGAGLSVLLTNFVFDKDGKISGDAIKQALLDVLLVAAAAGLGFVASGPAGAAMGLMISLAIIFTRNSVTFEGIQNALDELGAKVEKSSEKAKKSVENLFMKPTDDGLVTMLKNWKDNLNLFSDFFTDKQGEMASRAEMLLYHPLSQQSGMLSRQAVSDTDNATQHMTGAWENTAENLRIGFFEKINNLFRSMTDQQIIDTKNAVNTSREQWGGLPNWIKQNVTEPIVEFFNKMNESVTSAFVKTAEAVKEATLKLVDIFIESVHNMMQTVAMLLSMLEIDLNVSSEVKAGVNKSEKSTKSTTSYTLTPDVPQLAKGAVIPPNKKFLAVLGDQRHGTNIEAPLATIQEAVAMVMEDYIQSNLAGHEATVAVLQQILEAVLGIELDGETISNAVNSYNRKMAVVKGG